jgi:CheY-like chemotaxis protein
MRVLVVEDDKVTRELVTEQLLTGGHQVQAVESAESARALVGALGFPETSVIDICLPGLDGWILMRFLLQQ